MKAQILDPVSGCCVTECVSVSEAPKLDDAAQTAKVFKALGDETRLSIVALLGHAGCALCVCEIEPKFDLSQPTISHHLKVLRDTGLVKTERRGTWVYYSLAPDALGLVSRFVDVVWG